MGVQTLCDLGIDIRPEYDGAVYDSSIGCDCIIGGVGSEFDFISYQNSLEILFNDNSQAIIQGNFFKNIPPTSVELSANSVIYLCATIDQTQPDGVKGYYSQRSNLESAINRGDLNSNTGAIRDLPLWRIETSSTGIISSEKIGFIKNRNGGLNVVLNGTTLEITTGEY